MKSADEVTQKFWIDCFDTQGNQCVSILELKKYVTQAITAFAMEFHKAELEHAVENSLEEAAKIVLKAFDRGRDNGYAWVEDRAKYAADLIRALKGKTP